MIAALFFLMVFWHALADYPLQGDFLAKAKNRNTPIPGVPWWHGMAAHATIHAGGVSFITGFLWLGVAEFIAHWFIDSLKCAGLISYNKDQALHLACKALWAALAVLAF